MAEMVLWTKQGLSRPAHPEARPSPGHKCPGWAKVNYVGGEKASCPPWTHAEEEEADQTILTLNTVIKSHRTTEHIENRANPLSWTGLSALGRQVCSAALAQNPEMREAAAKKPKHWKDLLITEEMEKNCGHLIEGGNELGEP